MIIVHSEFTRNNKDEKIVIDLLDYAFNLSDDKPNLKRVMDTLLDDPKTDHHWFRFIDNFQLYNKKPQVINIFNLVLDVANQLIKKEF